MTTDQVSGVRWAQRAVDVAQQQLRTAVFEAREQGASWAAIADAMDMRSGSAVKSRFGPYIESRRRALGAMFAGGTVGT